MMRITIEQDTPTPRKFSLETSSELGIYEMAEELKIILIAMTYPPELMKEIFREEE